MNGRSAGKGENLYDVLGIKPDTNPEGIKSAYKIAARYWHPDRNSNPRAEAEFKKVVEAYYVLSDPERRAAHDQSLKEDDVDQQPFGASSGASADPPYQSAAYGASSTNETGRVPPTPPPSYAPRHKLIKTVLGVFCICFSIAFWRQGGDPPANTKASDIKEVNLVAPMGASQAMRTTLGECEQAIIGNWTTDEQELPKQMMLSISRKFGIREGDPTFKDLSSAVDNVLHSMPRLTLDVKEDATFAILLAGGALVGMDQGTWTCADGSVYFSPTKECSLRFDSPFVMISVDDPRLGAVSIPLKKYRALSPTEPAGANQLVNANRSTITKQRVLDAPTRDDCAESVVGTWKIDKSKYLQLYSLYAAKEAARQGFSPARQESIRQSFLQGGIDPALLSLSVRIFKDGNFVVEAADTTLDIVSETGSWTCQGKSMLFTPLIDSRLVYDSQQISFISNIAPDFAFPLKRVNH